MNTEAVKLKVLELKYMSKDRVFETERKKGRDYLRHSLPPNVPIRNCRTIFCMGTEQQYSLKS